MNKAEMEYAQARRNEIEEAFKNMDAEIIEFKELVNMGEVPADSMELVLDREQDKFQHMLDDMLYRCRMINASSEAINFIFEGYESWIDISDDPEEDDPEEYEEETETQDVLENENIQEILDEGEEFTVED